MGSETTTQFAPVIAVVFGQSGMLAGASLAGREILADHSLSAATSSAVPKFRVPKFRCLWRMRLTMPDSALPAPISQNSVTP